MSNKTHFKLQFNDQKFRFASTQQGEQLFSSVTDHVKKIVGNKPFALFWNDDESDVVLESVADLSTAIDFAKCARKSPSDIPCVRIFANCPAGADLAPHEPIVSPHVAADATPVDMLSGIKEELLNLFAATLSEQWTAGIRSDLKLFFSLPSSRQKSLMGYFASHTNKAICYLRNKIPVELEKQLKSLNSEELTELMLGDWLEAAARERRREDGVESPSDDQLCDTADRYTMAVSDVWMLVELCIDNTEPERVVDPWMVEYTAKLAEERAEEWKTVEDEKFDPIVERERLEIMPSEEIDYKETDERRRMAGNFLHFLSEIMPIPAQGDSFFLRLNRACSERWIERRLIKEEHVEYAELIEKLGLKKEIEKCLNEQQDQTLVEIVKDVIRYLEQLRDKHGDDWLFMLRAYTIPYNSLKCMLLSDWQRTMFRPFLRVHGRRVDEKIEQAPKFATKSVIPRRFSPVKFCPTDVLHSTDLRCRSILPCNSTEQSER